MIDCTGNREAAFEQAGWSSGMWWRGGADWTIRLARTASCAAALYPWWWVSSCIWWRFGADATADIAGAA
jgi:hypothetical protein